jgi:hypothetical protein
VAEERITQLTNVVAGENAAIWAYGFLLAFLNESDYPTGLRTFNLHRDARDEARLALRALNQTPPRPLPNYDLPFSVNNSQSAKALAAYLEDRLAGIYAQLAGVSVDAARIGAFEKSLAASQRYYSWIKKVKSFPGAID